MSAIPTYSRPLAIMVERKANFRPAEGDRGNGVKGGYFCGRCRGEVVLSASSQLRIASRPDGTLLCVQCVGRDPVLAWKFWKEIAG